MSDNWSSSRDVDVLVDLVDRFVDRSEFEHLRAGRRDKTTVGGAAGGLQVGGQPGMLLDRLLRGLDQFALGGQKRVAGYRPVDVVVELVLVEDRFARFR